MHDLVTSHLSLSILDRILAAPPRVARLSEAVTLSAGRVFRQQLSAAAGLPGLWTTLRSAPGIPWNLMAELGVIIAAKILVLR